MELTTIDFRRSNLERLFFALFGIKLLEIRRPSKWFVADLFGIIENINKIIKKSIKRYILIFISK